MDGQPTQVLDYVNYGVAEFGDADQPDPLLHRFDATLGKRAATLEETAAQSDARLTETAQYTSRQKDILATLAYIVRAKDVTAWNAMTAVQKRTAVFAQADIWRDLRVLADKL